jgi:hypothetical protein
MLCKAWVSVVNTDPLIVKRMKSFFQSVYTDFFEQYYENHTVMNKTTCSLESSAKYCYVVKLKLTDIPEVHNASIIRAMSTPCTKE